MKCLGPCSALHSSSVNTNNWRNYARLTVNCGVNDTCDAHLWIAVTNTIHLFLAMKMSF